eukprot:scaffold88354_cov20-Tisochrysis_lutea.AAC.1
MLVPIHECSCHFATCPRRGHPLVSVRNEGMCTTSFAFEQQWLPPQLSIIGLMSPFPVLRMRAQSLPGPRYLLHIGHQCLQQRTPRIPSKDAPGCFSPGSFPYQNLWLLLRYSCA